MERQRDERLEPAGLVLQRPRAQHVIDALLGRLDVPVEHRHVRAHAEPMRDAMDVEIALGAALVVRDLRRTRSAKISAPPPGSESSPAAISSRSTCSSVMP